MNRAKRAVCILVSIVGLALPATATPAPEPSDDPLLAKTTRFCRLFLDREFDAAQAMMSSEMKAAFGADLMAQVHDQVLAGQTPRELGEPWLEEVTEGYRRYRIPVHLADVSLDLRVVFDDAALVSGFFRTAHVPATAETVARRQKEAPGFVGHWEGTIEVPGTPLRVLLDLGYTDGYWSGKADIPAQAAMGLPLGGFEVSDEGGLSFRLVGIPGDPTFRAVLKDGRMTGTFIQGGAYFPMAFARAESAGPSRPQEPKPPFPYVATDVAFENGDVTLAGTLTVPEGDGPFPAAVLVSGSGPQDRNEEVFDHKPFLVLADHLTRAGIAVLRYDDRGVGESTGVFGTVTSIDFKDDALAAVRFLKDRPEIDPARIGMIGHSEGGLVAPVAAAESEDVAFLVLMAGPGVPGKEILVRQVGLLSAAAGGDDAYVAKVREEQGKAIDLVLADAPEADIRAQVRKLIAAQAGADPGAAGDAAVENAMAQLRSPWFRFFLGFDPRPALRKVTVPVLAINGEKDLQVDPSQNLPEIAKALGEAGNPDVTTREFPNLNHLFQEAGTGAVGEYYELEETLHPPVLDAIRDWILERFGGSSGSDPL